MQAKSSRLENSKDVRRILNRFGVDLSHCQYSVAGREIRLSGWLLKVDGSDFGGQEIESMIYEFQATLKGFIVRGEMENWSFSTDHIQCMDQELEQEIEEAIEGEVA